MVNQITARKLPADLMIWVKQQASEAGISMSAVVKIALVAYRRNLEIRTRGTKGTLPVAEEKQDQPCGNTKRSSALFRESEKSSY